MLCHIGRHTRFNGFSDDEEDENSRESQNSRQHRRNGYQRQNMLCHIGDGVVQAICLPWSSHVKCKNLKHLSLPLSKLHNPRLDEFNGRFKTAGIFNHMRHLDLSYISEIYDDSLSTLFKQNPGLTVLKLKSCLGLNGDCLFHLSNNCELLRELDLGYCTEINPDTGAYNIRKMLERKPNLRKLDLTGMRQFKDAHMNQMLIKTGKLVSLDLNVTNVTPDSLRLIARSAYNLKHICLNSCLNLTVESIKNLTVTRQNLTEIDLCTIYEFSDEDLVEMLDKNKNVVRVDVQWTDVTDDCVDGLFRSRS